MKILVSCLNTSVILCWFSAYWAQTLNMTNGSERRGEIQYHMGHRDPSDLWFLSCLPAIINPKHAKDSKSFNFDYSYWSHTSVTLSALPQHKCCTVLGYPSDGTHTQTSTHTCCVHTLIQCKSLIERDAPRCYISLD